MQYTFQGEFEKELIIHLKDGTMTLSFYEFAFDERVVYIVKMSHQDTIKKYGEFIPFMTTIYPYDNFPKPAITDRFANDDFVHRVGEALRQYVLDKNNDSK